MTSRPGPDPDFAELADWVDGRLTPERAAAVASHVTADARSRARADWLRDLVATGARLPLAQPPSVLRDRLRADFAHWHASQQALRDEIQDFTAAVLYDSRSAGALAGTRGSSTADAVHLAYSTATADLVLDIHRLSADRVAIEGQVLVGDGSLDAGGEIEVRVRGRVEARATTDALGRFELASVTDGVDEVHVLVGSARVLVAALDLRSDPG